MQAGVGGELGMEGGAQARSLANGDDGPLVAREDFDPHANMRHHRGADKHPCDRIGQADHCYRVFEAMHLRAKGVAAYRDVQQAKPILVLPFDGGGHHHQAHARAPQGHPGLGARLNGGAQAKALKEEANGCALTAGNDQALDAFKVLGGSHLIHHNVRYACAQQGSTVLVVVALNRQNPNASRHPPECTGRPGRIGGMLEIHGVPFDRCGRRSGSALGPAAIRHAGLVPSLNHLGQAAHDTGDLTLGDVSAENCRLGSDSFDAALNVYAQLARRTRATLERGNTPVVLGGDHSLAAGSVAGALQATQGDLAVLWIDAHADVNTPDESLSGNLHGMPVAALLGRPVVGASSASLDWNRLLGTLVPEFRLAPDRMGWLALRDVDRSEQAAIRELPKAFAGTMQDVDRFGLERVVHGFFRWLEGTGARHLWVSFDVDALDPFLAPGTGTAVRGGLTYREGHLLAELLHEHLHAANAPTRLVGLDIVETNPLFDVNNETARMAVEWINSLFGKSILGGGRRHEF